MTIDRHHYKYGTMVHTHSILETYVFLQWFFSKKTSVCRQRKDRFFFLFSSKKFLFWFRDFCQTVEKTKKRIICALDLIITSALSIEEQHTHLLFLPSSRISSTTTRTFFAENNEPFFVCGALSRRAKRSSFGGELDALGIYTECGGDLV